ncbi:MFS transporter, PPP family, 3-phenylpropionic acid transporter [Roseomonas rosea]|uniref:MFS transporter, PPP family, 3-phenylpropionic acid transporter n=1 Tax=Muricoccus roseus TaxID=198092 RepID=A0A1M6NJR6_9PROT|nr:MFS transporter [Roseomonas rosea]SHJ95896.1 MFS transporter, PPP family, 3-phenylpropionic acid transporter [Roseomonas rosea]
MTTSPSVPETAPPLARFALLLAACFLGVGVSMPFLPPFLAGRGLGAEAVAQILFAGSLIRFFVSPALGRLADRIGDGRAVLIPCAALAALAAPLFLPAEGFWAVLGVQLLFAAAMAPLSPVGEAMALAATRRAGVDYGPVRAAGSAAFILGAAGAGGMAAWGGYAAVPWLLAGSYAAAALAAWLLPRPPAGGQALRRAGGGGLRGAFALHLLRRPGFGRLVAISALVQGSHAACYGFSSIHWARAGHSAETIGLLWAEGVMAEVLLFLWARPLLGRVSPRGLMLLAAGAGMLRWVAMGITTELWALVPLQALHALTFGAQYMGAMRWLSANPPPGEALAAQSLHAALGTTGAQAVAMLATGWLYARVEGGAFLAMALLCALAVPVAWGWRAGR